MKRFGCRSDHAAQAAGRHQAAEVGGGRGREAGAGDQQAQGHHPRAGSGLCLSAEAASGDQADCRRAGAPVGVTRQQDQVCCSTAGFACQNVPTGTFFLKTRWTADELALQLESPDNKTRCGAVLCAVLLALLVRISRLALST